MNDFERGQEYADLSRDKAFYLYTGYALLVGAPIWFFFSVWDFNKRFYGSIELLVLSLLFLLSGYDKKKQMKKCEVDK